MAIVIEKKCRICGCTDALGCAAGDTWVSDPDRDGPLCSACVEQGYVAAKARALIEAAVQASGATLQYCGDRGWGGDAADTLLQDALHGLSAATWALMQVRDLADSALPPDPG